MARSYRGPTQATIGGSPWTKPLSGARNNARRKSGVRNVKRQHVFQPAENAPQRKTQLSVSAQHWQRRSPPLTDTDER